MNARETYHEAIPITHRRSRLKASEKKLISASGRKSKLEDVSYEDFCERYGLRHPNLPIAVDAIDEYVGKHKLQEKNWAEMVVPFDHLQQFLGREEPILLRLIYAICHKQLQEISFKTKDGARKTVRGTTLRKKVVREQNEKRNRYLMSLEFVYDYLNEIAPFLAGYQGDDKNPLSGYRMRELKGQLKALLRAEREIEQLRRDDLGRKALYSHDPRRGRYVRVGTAVDDPVTVLLLYAERAKKLQTGLSLTTQDFELLASIVEFWEFLPSHQRADSVQIIELLRGRMKHYKKQTLHFTEPYSSRDYRLQVFSDK